MLLFWYHEFQLQPTQVNFPERIFVLLFMFFALSAFAVSVASLTQAAERSSQGFLGLGEAWGFFMEISYVSPYIYIYTYIYG